ncbi:MAG: recombinase family protein [Actinomycetota bacterium]|nr:recombinase family protein [Actinomycetota bacterium]
MTVANGVKPVAGYWRVSRDEPGKESPQDYERAIRRWAEDNDRRVGQIFGDLDVSGKGGTRRPQQEQLFSRLDEFSAVVVPRLDRLSRHMVEAIGLCDVILDSGADFIALDVPGLDTTTPYGGFVRDMLLRIGQLYLDQISAQWKVIHERLAEQGRYHGGGATPFGYRFVSKPEAERTGEEPGLHIDADAAPVVVEMFERYLEGQSLHAIADDLRLRRVPTRSGGRWNHSQVKSVLENPAYAGVLRRREYRTVRAHDIVTGRPKERRIRTGNHQDFPGAWEPIIATELWDKVSALREVHREASKKSGAKNINRGQYLLTGLLYCGTCEERMFHKGNLYICPNKECDDGGIAGQRADRLVSDAFMKRFSSPKVRQALKVPREPRGTQKDPDVELREIERQMERLIELSLNSSGPIAQSAFDKKAAELEEWRRRLEQERANEIVEGVEVGLRVQQLSRFLMDVSKTIPELYDETSFDTRSGQFLDADIQRRYEEVVNLHLKEVPAQRQIFGLLIDRIETVPTTRPKELDLYWHDAKKPLRLAAPITRVGRSHRM